MPSPRISPMRRLLRVGGASAWASLPELPGGEAGAFGHAGELGPYHRGIHRGLTYPRAESAVGPGDHVLAADQPRVTADALGHQLGVLDEVGGRIEHARDQHLVFGWLDALEHLPLVRVARVRSLERETVRTGGEDDVEEIGDRNVVVMRALVVAPAQMQARALGRDVGEGVV